MSNIRNLTVLYGSQTGTAQDLAEQIWRESKRFHFKGPVTSLDTYDVSKLISEKVVIFVCSTTGQGDEPDSMKMFWKFLLRKNLPRDSLSDVSFAVLGLGDSSYVKFNFVAKKLNKRLLQLGGREILPIGLCDDQHDLGASAVYSPWTDKLWFTLNNMYPLSAGLNILSESPRQYRWLVDVIEENKENNSTVRLDVADIYDDTTDPVFDKPFKAIVEENIRTTSENHFQDVRLIKLDVDCVRWTPGDVFCVRPRNSIDKVNRLFELFEEFSVPIYPEMVVSLLEIDSEMPVPLHLLRPISLRTAATQLWDLNAIPRVRALQLLSLNCTDPLEKDKLNEFQTPEGQEELYSYANRPRRTILEVLQDFPHSTSKLTIPVLFELFGSIKPRSFSIASSCESGTLDLLVAIVEYKTLLKEPRRGLCSNWLKQLKKGDELRGVVKKGTMVFPVDNKPIVMVGPGTGIAPFRSLIQERKLTQIVGPMVLYFGCRGRESDFHFRKDLELWQQLEHLVLFTAFSRDQSDKIYVQHRIKECRELLRDLIQIKGGYFYVAGNSKDMPTAVKEALAEVLENGKECIQTLIKSGRYQEETWS